MTGLDNRQKVRVTSEETPGNVSIFHSLLDLSARSRSIHIRRDPCARELTPTGRFTKLEFRERPFNILSAHALFARQCAPAKSYRMLLATYRLRPKP